MSSMTKSPNQSPSMPQSDIRALKEKLAAIEHERWSDWQKWMHSLMGKMGGTKYVLDAEYIKRWERQIMTSYADLTEREQQSDMEQVDRYWPLIEEYITNHTNAARINEVEQISMLGNSSPEIRKLVNSYQSERLKSLKEEL